MIRKYASLLTTAYTTFTFGFSMPILFTLATLSFSFQFIVDKLLITYYYKQKVEHNDFLNRNFLKALKYSPVIFFCVAARSCDENYCAVTNVVHEIKYTNHLPACTGTTQVTTMLYTIGFSYLAIMIAIELAMFFRRRKLKFIN
jgi:hypothetical protein